MKKPLQNPHHIYTREREHTHILHRVQAAGVVSELFSYISQALSKSEQRNVSPEGKQPQLSWTKLPFGSASLLSSSVQNWEDKELQLS